MYIFIIANFYQIKVDNLAHQHSCTYKETLKRIIPEIEIHFHRTWNESALLFWLKTLFKGFKFWKKERPCALVCIGLVSVPAVLVSLLMLTIPGIA